MNGLCLVQILNLKILLYFIKEKFNKNENQIYSQIKTGNTTTPLYYKLKLSPIAFVKM